MGQHARRQRGRDDQGSFSLEAMVVVPAVLLLILLVVHAALWWHARNVALAAAQQGVESARVRGATLSDGTAAAQAFATRAGGTMTGIRVTGSRGAQVRIDVAGSVPTVFPGLTLHVDQHAEGAAERLTQAPP